MMRDHGIYLVVGKNGQAGRDINLRDDVCSHGKIWTVTQIIVDDTHYKFRVVESDLQHKLARFTDLLD